MKSKFDVYTIGHSTLSYEGFFKLLKKWEISAIGDVRSAPFSRRYPHFSRDALRAELKADGVSYVFLGKELGGRPEGRQFFCDGVADYEAMACRPEFKQGTDRVIQGLNKGYKIALMCSEHNPLDCHRCLLVGRALRDVGLSIGHILNSGGVKTHADIEAELIEMANLPAADMLSNVEDKLAIAYRERSKRVAYSESGPNYPAAAE